MKTLKKLLTILFALVIYQSYTFAQGQIEKDIEEKNNAAKKAKKDTANKTKKPQPTKKKPGFYGNVPITPGIGTTTAGKTKSTNNKTYDPTFFLKAENTLKKYAFIEAKLQKKKYSQFFHKIFSLFMRYW